MARVNLCSEQVPYLEEGKKKSFKSTKNLIPQYHNWKAIVDFNGATVLCASPKYCRCLV